MNSATSKNLVFLFKSSPYGDSRAKEGLDALLAASIFEQKISLIFVGDGVNQLAKNQAPSENKNYGKMLSALPMYDITAVFALKDDMDERGLSPSNCVIEVSAINVDAAQQLLSAADHVFSY